MLQHVHLWMKYLDDDIWVSPWIVVTSQHFHLPRSAALLLRVGLMKMMKHTPTTNPAALRVDSRILIIGRFSFSILPNLVRKWLLIKVLLEFLVRTGHVCDLLSWKVEIPWESRSRGCSHMAEEVRHQIICIWQWKSNPLLIWQPISRNVTSSRGGVTLNYKSYTDHFEHCIGWLTCYFDDIDTGDKEVQTS